MSNVINFPGFEVKDEAVLKDLGAIVNKVSQDILRQVTIATNENPQLIDAIGYSNVIINANINIAGKLYIAMYDAVQTLKQVKPDLSGFRIEDAILGSMNSIIKELNLTATVVRMK